jgi:hypothetical protein
MSSNSLQLARTGRYVTKRFPLYTQHGKQGGENDMTLEIDMPARTKGEKELRVVEPRLSVS